MKMKIDNYATVLLIVFVIALIIKAVLNSDNGFWLFASLFAAAFVYECINWLNNKYNK